MFTRVPRVHLFIRVCAAFHDASRCVVVCAQLWQRGWQDERIGIGIRAFGPRTHKGSVRCFQYAPTCNNDVPLQHVHTRFNVALRPDLCLLNVHLRIDTFARVHTTTDLISIDNFTNNFSIFYYYLLDVCYVCALRVLIDGRLREEFWDG